MKKIITLLIVVAAGAALLWLSINEQGQGATALKQRPKPNVVITDVVISDVRDEVEALGNIGANESITITSKVSDVIDELYFDDGQFVSKGQLLVQLRNDEQQARVAAAKVKLTEQMRELARIRTLLTNQTVAELERDRLQSQMDTAKAELDQAQAALNEREIKAPFAGRLGLRRVSNGALVTPSMAITTLDDIGSVKLDFSVPERFISSLSPGKVVEATAVAFDNQIFAGKVTLIDNRVNETTRAVTVRAMIPNPEAKLLPGMLMKVKLIQSQRRAIMIPEAAIIPQQNRHYVYVVNPEGSIEQKQVTLGKRQLGIVEIVEGLTPGEQLVIRGILKVRPGDEVQVQRQENFSALSHADEVLS
ncbi:efflux RND transporter periplasmic adaptor subunit [Shewanella sp. NIFS-20-20]|uniref:efflux RND transporter periplasmic adaptor subunit n=1 Tax=Shewanella sp. NIFS-20-20 TaxID=2853806 RepID=UPI001C4863C3|nr:efflux RND transporter periplasmic adaptor subunit [Shewanella sp. NIFS-20-20]MBV7317022.1 efflux RND transporter periplasmic adaptor subunit [Shewanella sp. NIFS-20-20]